MRKRVVALTLSLCVGGAVMVAQTRKVTFEEETIGCSRGNWAARLPQWA
jgi:hypothetical protein